MTTPVTTPRRLAAAAQRRYTHAAAPPLLRGSMAPTPWVGFRAGLRAAWTSRTPADAAPLRGWQRAAAKRRTALLALVLLSAALAATLLVQSEPMHGAGLLRWAQVGLFTLLFAWVTAGTVTAARSGTSRHV